MPASLDHPDPRLDNRGMPSSPPRVRPIALVLVTTMFLAFGTIQLMAAPPAWPIALAVAIAAAGAGAIAELFSGRVDDNIAVPLTSAGAAALVMLGNGLSL